MVTLRERLWPSVPERVAFVFSGGGNLGAVQVGMLKSLLEAGIRPDVVVGCSVGALNGAAVAAVPSRDGVARLEAIWRSLGAADLMPAGWLPDALQLARRGESMHANDGLLEVIDRFLTYQRFDELPVSFQCVATDVDAAEEKWFHSGPLRPAILASAALPAVYPPVEVDGVRYLDGAIVNDVPISRALHLGATTIYVLQTGSFARSAPKLRRPIDAAVTAYWIARTQRFKRDVEAIPSGVRFHLLPTGSSGRPRYNDFTRTAALIDGAYEATQRYLHDAATAVNGDGARATGERAQQDRDRTHA